MHINNWKAKKEITKKDIQKKEIHDAVVWQIAQAYDTSEQKTNQKRKYHRLIDEKVKQLHNDDRMNYDLLFSYKKSFIAMFQDEGMFPVYQEKDFYDQEITDSLNKMAKEDMKNMNKQIKDQKMLWDIFDYWVWLRVYNGYNKELWSPIFITPSPMSWYPDPAGNAIDNNYDYHMFYYETSKADLEYMNKVGMWFFNLDKVMESEDDRSHDTTRQKKYRLQDNDSKSWGIVWVYNCFITLNWYRYFCVVANDRDLIIKREPLDPKTPEEKRDPTLVPFKVSISHAMVDQYDTRGISYREKVYPVQVALRQLTNAVHQKELRNAWFGHQFYDPTRLQNPAYLEETNNDGPDFIPVVDLAEGWSPVVPYWPQEETASSQNYMKTLEFYAENTTALTGITRGLTPDAWTLWEAEIQMQKSNALFSVDAKSLMRWEQMFWEYIWFRSLQENLSNTLSKTAVVWQDNKQAIEITAKDMKKYGNPYVSIVSKRSLVEENQKKIASMQAYLPILLQDQNAPEITKKIFKRELMKLQGIDEEFIMSVEPMTASERHSKEMLTLINNEQTPKNLIVPWMDLETLWIYMNKARESETKQKVLNTLNLAMIDQWVEKPQAPTWDMQWLANSVASQAMWNQIQQGMQPMQ